MTDTKNIPLACHSIDRLLLSEVARILWCDVFWSDDQGDVAGAREAEYRQQYGALFIQDITARPETPNVPDLDDALFKLFHIVGRIEQAWGKSFRNVTAYICREKIPRPADVETLVYRTIMACIGHGIGPDDDGKFPEDLDAAPIDIENPLYCQLELLP